MSKLKRFINNASWYEKTLLVLFSFLMCTVAYFTFFETVGSFTSDVATANLLAREQIREKAFFPEGWVYGQDIWIITLNIPIVLLSFFMSDQVLIRQVAEFIFILLGVSSVIYLSNKVFKNNAWIVLGCLLFCMLSNRYIDVVFNQVAYMPIMFNLFFAIAYFMTIFDEDFKCINNKRLVVFTIYSIILLIAGLRYIQAIYLPLIGALIFVGVEKNLYNNKKSWHIDDKIYFIYAVYLLILVCIGYIIFIGISKNINYVAGDTNPIYFNGSIVSNIDMLIRCALAMMGFAEGVELFSLVGILNGVKIISTIFLLVLLPIKLTFKYREQCFKMKIFIVFVWLHIMEIGYLVVFCGMIEEIESARYLISSIYSLFALSAYYIYEYLLKQQRVIVIFVTVMMMVFSLGSNLPYYVAWADSDRNVSKENVCGMTEFLLEHDLNFGYATYWNAGKNTVLSNFEVEVLAVDYYPDGIHPYYWLSSTKWYQPEYHTGRSFLLMTEAEKEFITIEKIIEVLGYPDEVLRYENMDIYVYPYNIAEKAWGFVEIKF